MFGRKSRGQVIGEELSEGLSHVRTAANEATKAAAEMLAPRVEAAKEVVTPRVDATREVITKGYETARSQAEERISAARTQALAARDQAEARLAAAREQAESRRVGIAEAGRRAAKKTAKRARKNAKRARKTALVARKDAKAALADVKAEARAAAKAVKSGPDKQPRRWPWLLAALAVVGAVVAKKRTKTDNDLWGSPSDSPVSGYTEDPHPNSTQGQGDDQEAGPPSSNGVTDMPTAGTGTEQTADQGTDGGATVTDIADAMRDTASQTSETDPNAAYRKSDEARHAASDSDEVADDGGH